MNTVGLSNLTVRSNITTTYSLLPKEHNITVRPIHNLQPVGGNYFPIRFKVNLRPPWLRSHKLHLFIEDYTYAVSVVYIELTSKTALTK